MFKLALFSLATLLVASLASGAPTDSAPTNCSDVEALLNKHGPAQGLTTLSKEYPPWTTAEELQQRCPISMQAFVDLKKVNKDCFSGLTKEVFSAALKSRQALTEKACKPGSKEFDESVEASKCIKDKAFTEMQQAERDVIKIIQVLLDTPFADNKERIRRSCCSTNQGKAIILGVTKDKCPQSTKLLTDYLDSYMSDALGIICTEPDKLQCDKVEPVKFESVPQKYDFYVVPILKMIKTMDL